MRTTKEDYRQFQDEVKRLVQVFGLTDWTLSFERDELSDANANVEYNILGRSATFTLGKHIAPAVEQIAFHETIHLLLADVSSLASSRFISIAQVDVAEEAAVIRLENMISGKV